MGEDDEEEDDEEEEDKADVKNKTDSEESLEDYQLLPKRVFKKSVYFSDDEDDEDGDDEDKNEEKEGKSGTEATETTDSADDAKSDKKSDSEESVADHQLLPKRVYPKRRNYYKKWESSSEEDSS